MTVRGTLGTAVLILGLWVPHPALAEDGAPPSTTSYQLVDQALQELRADPPDVELVLDLISQALEIESRHPSGTVKNLELQSTVTAIRRGNLHDAELRLAAALAPDRHAAQHDPLASAPPRSLDPLPAGGVSAPGDVGEADSGRVQIARSASSLWPSIVVILAAGLGGFALGGMIVSGRRRGVV